MLSDTVAGRPPETPQPELVLPDAMHVDGAVNELKEAHAEIARLRLANQTLKRKYIEQKVANHGMQRKMRRLTAKAVKKEKTTEAMALVQKKGRAKRYFDFRSGMLLAAKRCMSNTASYSLGLALGIDVSGQTVRSWELELRAAQITSFRSWQRRSYQEMASPTHRLAQDPLRCDEFGVAISIEGA